VHALKFSGRTALADVMAAQIVANAPPGLLEHGAALVPAPTHPQRRRTRGFDQAQVLARAIGRRSGLPVVRALERDGPVRTQMGAGRGARRRGIAVSAVRAVPPHVVIVDDVHTTGATLDVCARALKDGGARWVGAITYVRTL
jgi:predicted amidophosphoribosyltransferase